MHKFNFLFSASVTQMKNTTEMPPIEAFYSHLREETVTEEEYEFAKKVWKLYKCKNLLDYCQIYCRSDTLLLAENFQKFRKVMFEFCGLDPAYYISLPSFAWDSMLKMTNVELESFTDIDQNLFCENGIRGGLSYIGERYYEANEDKTIHYIDANVRIMIN